MLKNLVSVVALSACCAVHASPVIDQDSPAPPWGFTVIATFGFGSPPQYAQSFQQSRANITGAGVAIGANPDVVGVTISLYDALPNAGGTLLATGSGAASVGWIDVFWAPVVLQPLQTYFLVIAPDTEDMAFEGTQQDSYLQGQAFGARGEYDPIPATDFVFHTYAESAAVGEVPEPASSVLMGLALAGLLVSRKRATA